LRLIRSNTISDAAVTVPADVTCQEGAILCNLVVPDQVTNDGYRLRRAIEDRLHNAGVYSLSLARTTYPATGLVPDDDVDQSQNGLDHAF
jgi:hypothetical protein